MSDEASYTEILKVPLLHHAHAVVTEGTSLRLTDATSGKGVMPLT